MRVPIPISITDLIALTRRAKLFIGGDTGPLHLAAALRVPVVAIFERMSNQWREELRKSKD